MKLSELMKNYTPNPDYEGELMADDYVLAIDTHPKANPPTDINDYEVVQEHFLGVDSALNAENNDKQYIRGGKSTTKKSVQRTFNCTADRYAKDPLQDFINDRKYSVGQDAITNYVYFDLHSGKGEKGKVSISVDTDGGGNAGDNAAFNFTLSKNGAQPENYNYSHTYTLTTEEPANWATNYTDYYTKSGDTYSPVTGVSAPVWAENTYYSKN